ncbi:conserved hypothetical protein [Leptospira interrogans serovar Manilae]|uniref:Uncharacterized protein n=1 Tax=Leptospira interrogans serovar Manilae TaxID=214675 RepID=A0AAQ1SMK4_LEPIR|nr:conserved hypothetical protein [Leptospira interrogans serovar Manilae]
MHESFDCNFKKNRKINFKIDRVSYKSICFVKVVEKLIYQIIAQNSALDSGFILKFTATFYDVMQKSFFKIRLNRIYSNFRSVRFLRDL